MRHDLSNSDGKGDREADLWTKRKKKMIYLIVFM
jgi:hypothetical protein